MSTAEGEQYEFVYFGAPFAITVQGDPPTTTDAPNLRTVSGTWTTWRLETDPTRSGLESIRLLRSVGPDGGPHPAGNLSEPASKTYGRGMLMHSSDGYLYTIPTGYGVVANLFSAGEWAAQLAEWEAHVHDDHQRTTPETRTDTP